MGSDSAQALLDFLKGLAVLAAVVGVGVALHGHIPHSATITAANQWLTDLHNELDLPNVGAAFRHLSSELQATIQATLRDLADAARQS